MYFSKKDEYFCCVNKPGQKSIIWDGYRYRLDGTLKTGDILTNSIAVLFKKLILL